MLEFLEVNDLSSYILFASMFIKIAILIGFFTYLKVYLSNRSSFRIDQSHYQEIAIMHSQILPNEINSFGNWLALYTRRKESPDEGPSHLLLGKLFMNKFQGGTKWRKNQIKLYPLLSKELLY
ncbi:MULTISPECIES: hypothetical protein [Bacillus]|uniref:hypothetical protein n=1 Tax=Bacillus TaxID=1386 RepID=UPI00036FCA14|nr:MULTISPECIES: hypothetical protein [Bacillus]